MAVVLLIAIIDVFFVLINTRLSIPICFILLSSIHLIIFMFLLILRRHKHLLHQRHRASKYYGGRYDQCESRRSDHAAVVLVRDQGSVELQDQAEGDGATDKASIADKEELLERDLPLVLADGGAIEQAHGSGEAGHDTDQELDQDEVPRPWISHVDRVHIGKEGKTQVGKDEGLETEADHLEGDT